MCGIAGIAGVSGSEGPSLEIVRTMCDTLVHRGPDDEGLAVADGVGLGMRRLSIIDVAGGRQPLCNEDDSVRVVFNGEIYNYRELRADLERRGHRFRSATDGEVLPHLYEEHGDGFLERLNGMFAVALHDRRRKRLVLARDRLGIKPLFWTEVPGALVFGSEVKAILASGLVERRLDVEALGQFVSWEYVPAPRTLLRGVHKLEPGTRLAFDLASGSTAQSSYWDLPVPGEGDLARSDDEWAEEVDALVRESVRRQLVSDVPLGAFLSGGVDSSLVVSAMGPARTFSIGFDDPSYSEVKWSRRVGMHLGVNHRVETLEPRVDELFERLMPFMDDPIGDFSIFPTYLVSKVAREEVTVALTGDGGDELFGGYETYVAQEKARTWQRLPAWLRQGWVEPWIRSWRPRPAKKGLINKARRFVEGLEHDARLGHARWRLFVGRRMREALFTPEALALMERGPEAHVLELSRSAASRDELERCLYVDVKSYLVDNCLVKVDRMSMACSLEARVPLLDHELAELAFRLPSRLKVARGGTKVLLKRVAARHVPRECVYRPKEGFSIPIKHWLSCELRPLMQELLDADEVAAEGLLRADAVKRLQQEHLDGSANHSHVLWALMVFRDWRRRWGV